MISAAFQRNARILLAAALFGLSALTLREFIPALAWSTVLAIALWPVYRRMCRHVAPGPHGLYPPLLFTAIVAVVLGLPFVLLGIEGAREAHEVVGMYRRATTDGLPVPDALAHLPYGAAAAQDWWRAHLSEPSAPRTALAGVDRGTVIHLGHRFGVEVAHRLVTFALTLLVLFFLLKDGRSLVADFVVASERLFGPRGERVALQAVASVHGTVNGLVLVGIAEGFTLGVSYAVAGVPHAILLGALSGVTAMIPFAVFPVIAGVCAYLLLMGSVTAAVAVAAFASVMIFLADHLVRPVLIGGATRLPFVWVLFGILGGVETYGIVGLFVGPALMAASILLWRELVAPGPAASVDGG